MSRSSRKRRLSPSGSSSSNKRQKLNNTTFISNNTMTNNSLALNISNKNDIKEALFGYSWIPINIQIIDNVNKSIQYNINNIKIIPKLVYQNGELVTCYPNIFFIFFIFAKIFFG